MYLSFSFKFGYVSSYRDPFSQSSQPYVPAGYGPPSFPAAGKYLLIVLQLVCYFLLKIILGSGSVNPSIHATPIAQRPSLVLSYLFCNVDYILKDSRKS